MVAIAQSRICTCSVDIPDRPRAELKDDDEEREKVGGKKFKSLLPFSVLPSP